MMCIPNSTMVWNSAGVFLIVSILSVLSLDFPAPTVEEVGNNKFRVNLMRTVCFTNSNQTIIHKCKATLFRNKPTLSNISYSILKPERFVTFWFTLYYKYANYKPFLVDNKFDYCALMKNSEESVFAKYIVAFLKTQINWMHECPYQGTYNITNFKMVEGMLPPILPAGDYRADFRFINEKFNYTIIKMQQFFNIRAKGTADLSLG